MSEVNESSFDIAKFRAGDRNEHQLLFKNTYREIDLFSRLYLTPAADREAIITQVFYELFHQRMAYQNYDSIVRFILERTAQTSTQKINTALPPAHELDLNAISESMQEIFSSINKNQLLLLLSKYPPVNFVRFTKHA